MVTGTPSWAALILAACIICTKGAIRPAVTPAINPTSIVRPAVTPAPSSIPVDFKPPSNSSSTHRKFIFNTTTTTTTSTQPPVSPRHHPPPPPSLPPIPPPFISNASQEEDLGIGVGKSVNVLSRFGFLHLSVKVLPTRIETSSWLFREATKEPFRADSLSSRWKVAGGHRDKNGGSKKSKFDAHFFIDFCDTEDDLWYAYFDHFHVEGLDRPHRAFMASLAVKGRAKTLGISGRFLQDEFSFVLVRLYRRDRNVALGGDLKVTQAFKNATKSIRVGSTESAHRFMDEFGTHVIVEYEIGDLLFQVFVYAPSFYTHLKTTFALSESKDKLEESTKYFTPYYAIEVGEIKMVSEPPELESLRSLLTRRRFFFSTFPSIFQVLSDPEAEKALEALPGRAITALHLRKIHRLLPKGAEKMWLSEVIDNVLTLYFITM